MPIDQLKQVTDTIKEQFPHVVLLAAGGINETNIEEYATLNINGIVMSGLYQAKPIDIGVKMERID